MLARHEDVLLAEDVLLLLSFHYVLQSEGEDDWCEMIVVKMIMIIINNVVAMIIIREEMGGLKYVKMTIGDANDQNDIIKEEEKKLPAF